MRIGKGALGIAIEELSIRMRRGGIEVPPVLLDVLAMVALRVGQTEESLLEPVIATIPQRDREIEEAITVGQAGDAVLTPAIGACVGMLERERLPGIPSGRIVLADRAPLPAREIGPPQSPRGIGRRCVRQTGVLGARRRGQLPRSGMPCAHVLGHDRQSCSQGRQPRRSAGETVKSV